MNAGNGLWLADGNTFSKNDFISRGCLNTINGILKFLQEMHVTVAHQQQEMLDETCLKNINCTTNAAIYISPSVVIRVQFMKHHPFQSLKHILKQKSYSSLQ